MPPSEHLIDIRQVAETFGKSVESIRKYKNFGIIRVTDKRGNKDLFDRSEILKIRDRLRDLRLRGLSLAQIADELDDLRPETAAAPAATATATPRPAPTERDPDQPVRVLIVDDEDDLRGNIAEYLQGNGYVTSQAADGEEAITKAFTEKPDLILLDLRLPKVDGYQVCQTLKGNPITSVIPIIMITALVATPQKIKGIEYGADDYIGKPFDLEEMLARVKMVMRRLQPR